MAHGTEVMNRNLAVRGLKLISTENLATVHATVDGVFDFNGMADALVLDADGNTTISAPTNDQIDVEIAGADDFTFTANAFNVLTGSALTLADDCAVKWGTGLDILMAWDGTRFNVTQATANSEIRWGVDAAGIDQMWYGDTASTFMNWDQSADSLIFADNAKVVLGTGSDITVAWDGTRLNFTQAAVNSEIRWGIDGAGIDQIFYGDTASANLTWDQSADKLIVNGNASVQGLRTSSSSAAAITTTRVLTLADAGGVFSVAQSSAYDIDVPDPTTGPGCRYTFYLTAPGAFNVTITCAGAATFVGTIVNDVTSVIPATGSTLTFASGASVLGDSIEIVSISTSLYLVRAVSSAASSITVS